MKTKTKIKFQMINFFLPFSLIWTLFMGSFSNFLSQEIEEPFFDYQFIRKSENIVINPGDEKLLWFELKNTGNINWSKTGFYAFRLGTSRLKDRESKFFKGNRIELEREIIKPGEIGKFSIKIKVPKNIKPGIYREYFRPVIEHLFWLPQDERLFWDIKVIDSDTSLEDLDYIPLPSWKKIKISIAEQKLRCFDDGDLVYEFIISTGKWSMPTPKGIFKIENKFKTAYSKPYKLWMNYWMAFTPDGNYGIHELPYWKLKNGKIIYEGRDHLGKRVSHGCVRLGIGAAEKVFNWAEIGTVVEIE